MQTAVDNVGLRHNVNAIYEDRRGRSLNNRSAGVWQRNALILRRNRDLKARTRTEYLRDIWSYGLSVRTSQTLVHNKLSLFRLVYDEQSSLDLNLIRVIKTLGLEAESKTAADEYFENAGISSAYLHEIVEPTVRMFFGRNLSELNALSALLAMDPGRLY